jgi:hypothetical protein
LYIPIVLDFFLSGRVGSGIEVDQHGDQGRERTIFLVLDANVHGNWRLLLLKFENREERAARPDCPIAAIQTQS